MKYTVADAFKEAGVQNIEPFKRIGMPFKLWKHQIRSLNKSLRMPRFGLYHRPRLGKTFVMLLNAVYCANYEVKSVILMPPVLFKQLQAEWDSLKDNPFNMHIVRYGIQTRNNRLKKWEAGEEKAPDVLIMTRQIFIKVNDRLRELGYDNLMWDECHLGLARATTIAFSVITQYVDRPNARLILSTGTPIPTSPLFAYPIIKLNNPEAYYDSNQFDRLHVVYTQIGIKLPNGKISRRIIPADVIGLEAIHQNLYRYADRETKGDGALVLSKPNIQVVPVELGRKHLQLYKRIGQSRLVEFPDGAIINAVQASKLRQVLSQVVVSPQDYGETIKDNAMVEMTKQLLDEFPVTEKIVVFAHYNSSCESLHAALKPYGASLLYGLNTPRQNEQALAAFTDPGNTSCRVLVCSVLAGGVGLTLGKVSSVVVFVEIPETYGQLDQAMSRVLLLGKEEPVTTYLLEAQDTLWQKRIPKLLQRTHEIQQVNMDKSTLLDELMLNNL